jgi:hypothetical protein
MPKRALVLLAGAALAACTVNSGLETTPTFVPARYVPSVQQAGPVVGSPPAPSAAKKPVALATMTGAAAIVHANREAMVDPDDTTMRGATWVIDDVQSSLIYRVRTALNRVTTILLPAGERFNGAVGGDVADFLINVSYAGPRPAVSILPRTGQARGNLQLVTTGGFYSFDLIVNTYVAVNLVDVNRKSPRASHAIGLPQPQGDFTRLSLMPEDGPLPAWAPAEAWADSYKMVVRFNGPLPTLPALFAGQRGEQIVSYSSQTDGSQVYLVTNRRVTEAELRLGSKKVDITVDPDATRASSAADPRQGAQGWHAAEALPTLARPSIVLVAPAQPASRPVAASVLPPSGGALEAGAPATGSAHPQAGRQPMAGNVLQRL